MKIEGRLYYVITALAVFLAGIMMIIWSMADTGKADYKDTVIDSDNTVSSIITCSSGNKVDFVALTKEDSRIYAYIDIVGTGIETPVIRSDDLTSGYAFTKSNNTKKFSERNTVIFLDSGTFAGFRFRILRWLHLPSAGFPEYRCRFPSQNGCV